MRNPEKAPAMLLLMGGKSSRMGLDKARLRIGNQLFWEKIAAELSACGRVYLSVGNPGDADGTGMYPCIVDEVPGCGVIGGLYSAFRSLEEELIFACACDMPFMDARFVRWLLERWEEEAGKGACWDGIVVYGEDGRTYSTAALYHRRILPQLEENIRRSHLRMHTLVREESRMLLIPMEQVQAYAHCFRNINTPEEYRQWVCEASASS